MNSWHDLVVVWHIKKEALLNCWFPEACASVVDEFYKFNKGFDKCYKTWHLLCKEQ